MLPNHFFHPYHIKPLSEFITAVMKMSDLSKSHIVMEKLLKVVNKLTEDALNEYGKDVIVKGYSCNVTDKNELEKAYSLISSELGTCDILINGAGGNQPGAIASTEMLKKEKGEGIGRASCRERV